jgi:N-acetyl-anhydromuramyl-L-alanine amidase AmpD
MAIHESQLMTAGTAVTTRSFGNTRSPSLGSIPVDEVPGRTGVFPVFISFLDGCASTVARLASPIWPHASPYGLRPSIESVFTDPSGANWAPAGDSTNDPNSYLGSMLRLMNTYQDQEDEWIAATRPPSPPILAKWLPGSHTKGRGGSRVLASVLHITAGGSAGSAYNWWLNIANSANPSSAHYIVDRDRYGTIWTCVREQDQAWANGILANGNLDKALVRRWVAGGINPNRESVSVEVAGYSPAQPHSDPSLNGYTEPQWRSLEFLLPSIAKRWGLAIDEQAVLGHKDIDSVNRKNCPGLSAAEWERVYAMDETTPTPGYATADEAFDAAMEQGETAVWAGAITGKGHWTASGRDPLELCRTSTDTLLGYDGAYAHDVTGYGIDEWESAAAASGQLVIYRA